MRVFFFILCLLLFFTPKTYGQGWIYAKNKDFAKFKFERIHNLIIVPIQLNGEQLSFILDTGVKETILFGLVDTSILNNLQPISFTGLGMEQEKMGFISLNNTLSIADSAVVDFNHNLYVVNDSSVNLSKHIDIPINGILGSKFFNSQIVKIDYSKRTIEVHRSLDHLKLKKYTKAPIQILRDRPHIRASFTNHNQYYDNNLMLLDLGNSGPMMLFLSKFSDYRMTEPNVHEYLGQGFNGAIYGRLARVNNLEIADFNFIEPYSSHPDSVSYDNRKILKDRKGSIGAAVWARFDMVINYADSSIYLKKNKYYRDPFNIDMSGLDVQQDGVYFVQVLENNYVKNKDGNVEINLNRDVRFKIMMERLYTIHAIREGSPASYSGIQIGDQLKTLNGRNVGKMTLAQIQNVLREKDSKRIRLSVLRDNKVLKFELQLQDPLSY